MFAFIAVNGAGAAGINTYLQIIASALALLISIVLFIAKRDTKLCAYGMLLSAGVVYFVVRLVSFT